MSNPAGSSILSARRSKFTVPGGAGGAGRTNGFIDPLGKALEIYRRGQAVEVQEGHSAVYGEGPVGGFVLELGRIWS